MNRPGMRVYSGTLTNVGTSYLPLQIDTPEAPPHDGKIRGIIAEITGGTGTKLRVKIEDVPVTGHDLEYDDPDVPGDPITAPLNFADPAVPYYDKDPFLVLVAADNINTNVQVFVTVETF